MSPNGPHHNVIKSVSIGVVWAPCLYLGELKQNSYPFGRRGWLVAISSFVVSMTFLPILFSAILRLFPILSKPRISGVSINAKARL